MSEKSSTFAAQFEDMTERKKYDIIVTKPAQKYILGLWNLESLLFNLDYGVNCFQGSKIVWFYYLSENNDVRLEILCGGIKHRHYLHLNLYVILSFKEVISCEVKEFSQSIPFDELRVYEEDGHIVCVFDDGKVVVKAKQLVFHEPEPRAFDSMHIGPATEEDTIEFENI